MNVLGMLLMIPILWLQPHVTYGDTLPKKYAPYVDACFAQWGNASGLNFERVSSGADITVSVQKSLGTQVAATSVSFQGNRITHAAIELNGTFYRWHAGRPWGVRLRFAGKSTAEIQAVLVHEIGHAIGMEHSDNQADVMYPWILGHTLLSGQDQARARILYGLSQANDESANRERFERSTRQPQTRRSSARHSPLYPVLKDQAAWSGL